MIDEELEPGMTSAASGEVDAADGPEATDENMSPETPHGSVNSPAGPASEEPDTGEPASMEEALKDEDLRAEFDQTFRRLHRGQLIKGTVIQVEPERVFVDLGGKTEGVVPLQELSADPLETAEGYVKVGDEISVVVLQPDSKEGNPVLSKKRADFEDTWNDIVRAFESGEVLVATVTERVKGGLLADLGVRGFVPATHVGNGKLHNIERFVGESLRFKILEVDRERRKVVLSNRLAEEERRKETRESLFHSLQVNDIVDGTVRRLVDYGAFVDIGGVDGLLHVSEMSWTRIDHPSEMLKEGDQIKVKILRMDPDAGKISLGYRQVLPDPWRSVGDKYYVGQVLEVPISRLVQSGAFCKLEQGVEAFLPVSEMAQRRVKKPGEVVNEGDTVKVQVIELQTRQRRMVLSIRALEHQTERREVERHMQSGRRGGATIGERLGALKELLKSESEGEPAETETAQAEPEAPPTEAEAPAETEAAAEQPEEPVAGEEPAEEAAPEQSAEGEAADETETQS